MLFNDFLGGICLLVAYPPELLLGYSSLHVLINFYIIINGLVAAEHNGCLLRLLLTIEM